MPAEVYDDAATTVTALYNALYHDFLAVQEQHAAGSPSREDGAHVAPLESYRALHERFRAATLVPGGTVCAAVTRAEAAARDAEAAVQELEAQLRLRSEAEEGRQRERTNRSVELQANNNSSSNNNSALNNSFHARNSYVGFATQSAELHAHLTLARNVFQALLARSAQDLREERVSAADVRFASPAAWRTRERYLLKLIREVQAKAAALDLDQCLAEDQEMLVEVQDLATAAAEHLRRGEALRRTRDGHLRVFDEECGKLMAWCRQQQANLDAMQQPDHVQEYCATLVENYPAMSQNFVFLLASVEEYVRANNLAVRGALAEASEVWFYLQITTFERLCKTLYELHPQSPLEAEAQRYAGFSAALRTFLQAMQAHLRAHPSFSDAAALRTETGELLHCLESYDSLPRAVREFANRARVLRSAYKCLREAVLTRLTFLAATADVVARSTQRQAEFERCITQLKKWAHNTARGESWRDIYGKIVDVKRMIKQEQAQLAAQQEM